MEAAYNVNSAGLSSQGRAISTTAIEQDQNIGLKVWIKTVENGKDYGFCEAIITGTRKTKDDKVEYVAKYCGWKGKYGAIISDLYDESEVKIDSPTPIEIQPDAADWIDVLWFCEYTWTISFTNIHTILTILCDAAKMNDKVIFFI